ncbi:uncharacterized protein L203_105517 [Cryptococcus depauperatus CBS 7841]|uniref:Ribonuclease P/MRP protein subunit POP5 n=1 Tax=Cryptococcus depauperatus CBS 7841 TaxID=1295531 RepID=A0A1E3ID20_9TREE|nr:ribonuclease P/MRP protein subunit POP5 [Cryptococcus depauperatus CBS 7841]
MVRFKNRYLLVEFLLPLTLSPNFSSSKSVSESILHSDAQYVEDDTETDQEEDEHELSLIPRLPLIVPTVLPDLCLGQEGNQTIYKTIKDTVQTVFGDEGWGRIASSFRVIYHSPLTTLTFIRVARHQYRLLWSAITFITLLNGVNVIPRVIAVSGTIKKLQNRGIAYHRAVIGGLISAGVTNAGLGWTKDLEKEREDIKRLQES